MLGLAFLSVAAAAERAQPPPPGLIPLTRNEIAWLLEPLIAGPAHYLQHRIGWSLWRRRHERRAQACHYRRHAAHDP